MRILFISARRRNEYAAIGEYYKKLVADPHFVKKQVDGSWKIFRYMFDEIPAKK